MSFKGVVIKKVIDFNREHHTCMYMLFMVILTTVSVHAQDSLQVSVKANVKEDKIQLRWVTNSPLAWKQSNHNGFLVERYTVVRNNVLLTPAEKVLLTPVPLKPQPLAVWKTLATTNNYAAVIAQALFGEDFQLSGDDAKGISKMMALAQELEQRYFVSMYAADLCYPAALLAGWGIEDKNVKPDERYLYRITPVVPAKGIKVEQGSAYVSLKDYQPLPQPLELTGIFGDKSVMLSWNYQTLSGIYNSYFIEKSNDGKAFRRLSDTPFSNMNSKDDRSNDRMFFMDTLVNNTETTYYKLIGVSSFGEEGPSSEVISGIGMNRLIYVPHIERVIPNEKGGVNIAWSFDERGNDQVKEFLLCRSDSDQGPFVPVVRNIAPLARSIEYDSLQSSNYLIIAAIPHTGEQVVSFPVLVQPSDTIPPAVPKGLTGIVDTLGVVMLSWKPNADKDILGYRIYRAQTKDEELIPLNDVAIRDIQFLDTIDVRNLNTKAYYAVTALDQRYNQSDKSAVLELQKPELVPPSAPIITNYKITTQGIELEWVTGEEENLATIKLFRNERGGATKEQGFTNVKLRTYTDETAEAGKYYSYSIQTVTVGGLASQRSPIVTIQAAGKSVLGSFENFTARRDRKTKHIVVRWKHNVKDVKELTLYRGENGSSVSLWKVLKGFEETIEDVDVKENAEYEYIIRAVLISGKTGATATVKFKN